MSVGKNKSPRRREVEPSAVTVKNYFFLYANFFLYSCSSVFAKSAAKYPPISMEALAFYAAAIAALGLYAIFWQQILKRIPLTAAYPNKAVTVLFGMVWGSLLFGERIEWNMILGVAFIMCGIVLMVVRHE